MNHSILHLDMNAFFASVEQRDNPALRGKPIAVAGGIGKRSVIATASYEARARGVKTAMSTWDALKICPELQIIIGNMSKYTSTARQIFEILTHYTDLVEIFSIDEAFMDVTHTAELFGSPTTIARTIKAEIRRRFGLTCSVGIGPTKTIAKLASNMQKPDGLVEIKPDQVPQLLENLPVQELCGIGARFTKHLGTMGIETVGQLGRTSKYVLTRRFGPALGEWFWRLGRGQDASPVRPYVVHEPAKSMGHSYTLPQNIRDREEVKTYLLQLSEQVGIRLRHGGYTGHVVYSFVRYSDFEGSGRGRDIHFYTNAGYTIYKYARILFDEIDDRSRAVRLVGVSLSGLMHRDRQLSFLHDAAQEDSLLHAIDSVNDKWGRGALIRARLMQNELAEKVEMVSPERYINRHPSTEFSADKALAAPG